MSNENDTTTTDSAPAVGGPLERGVGRLVSERLGARVWNATRRLLCPHTHGQPCRH